MTATDSCLPEVCRISGTDKYILLSYLLICTGLCSFLMTALGAGAAYINYIDEALLFFSLAYCLHLLQSRKLVVTGLTLCIAFYIVMRFVIVMSFALQHNYSLAGYLFPLKNWVLLLIFFIIGQSTELSERTFSTTIMKALLVTVLVIAGFEMLSSLLDLRFSQNFPLQSRVPFIRYRIGIDEFIIVYAYLVMSIQMLRNQVTTAKYTAALLLISAPFFIAQTKQLLVAILIVSVFIVLRRFSRYLTTRKVLYTLSVTAAGGAVAAGILYLYVRHPMDTYFSLWRRMLSLSYVRDKLLHYPLFGYPIPSRTFGGIIPQDIIHTFYGFDFNTTIFPSDLPLLFILAEEGIVGILFVALLLYLCYRRAPEKVLYLIVVLLALAGTFRMYYLIPVGSSFTYFILGYATRNKSGGQHGCVSHNR